MKKRKITKSLYLWVRSFITVLVVMIGILVALTTWMVREFSGEIEKMNHGLTSVLQTSIDTRLNDIDNFAARLQMNPTNLKLSRSETVGGLNKDFLMQLFRQLCDYKLSNAFIKEIYVYYPHLNYVVGDLGCFEAQQYYLLRNNLKLEGYEEWLDTARGQKKDGYSFTAHKDGTLELCLFRQLPYDLSGDKSAILMIVINKAEVEFILKNAKEGMGNTLTAVTDGDNTVYASFGDGIGRESLKESLEANRGKPLFKMNGSYGSVMESEYYGIKYVTLIERRQLLDSGYFIRNIAYASIALCMFFGAVLFVLLGRRNARPLKKILDRLVNKTEENSRILDDYDLIDTGISQMLKVNAESSRKLEEQRETIEGLFLCSLLSSGERSNSVIFASMQKSGIQMEYSLFQIGLIRNPVGFSPEELHGADLRIRGALKEKKDIAVITGEFEGDIALLFHMEPEYGRAEMENIGADILKSLNMTVECKLMLGGIYDSMSNIITSFRQAQTVAEFRENDRGSVFIYDETAVGGHGEAAYAGIMPEYEMAMLEEKFEEADRLLDLLFNQYIGTDRNAYTGRAKKYAVINPILTALENRVSGSPDYNREEYTGKLSEAKDSRKLLNLLHEGFGHLIRWRQKRQSDQTETVAERAKQYINFNFEDPMIGLYSVSDMLGVSNTYLSATFKKQYGTGLAWYINSLRIEKAKRLIINTDESMKEIAVSVGFSSDAAFIRVFKQFENTTPGRFKRK